MLATVVQGRFHVESSLDTASKTFGIVAPPPNVQLWICLRACALERVLCEA